MKVLQRHAVLAAGLATLVAGIPSILVAQRPGADVPRILVATFQSNDRNAGVEAGDAIRQRVTQEVPQRDLWVISKNDINNTLEASGYRPDSALSANDLKELAKLLRADEILDGTVTKTPNGLRVEPRLMLSRDVALVQPLPPVQARDAGDAAKQIERELSDARKQIEANTKCTNDLRAAKYQEAIEEARKGIKEYPQATLARLCLMSAYTYQKSAADTAAKTAVDSARVRALGDSVLTVANEILKIDPTSRLALGNAVEVYRQKGDTTNLIKASLALAKADPSNTSLVQSVVNILGQMNKPEVALPIIDQILQDNPGDPQLLRTRWVLLLAAGKYKDALAAGEEYVKADSAAANADYFTRQIAAAAADSQPQLATQIAARAVQKFPKDASLAMLQAQTLRKAGQMQQALDAAKRAVAIDPKVENGYLYIIVSEAELNQPDSALATARQAIAAGVDKNTIAQALVTPMGAVTKAAQTTPSRAAWETAYKFAAAVDSIAPSPNSKYFAGVAAFQAGLDALQNINKTKSCSDAQYADEMWANAQIAMPAGAEVDKNTAGQILGAIQQYSPAIAQAKKAFCKKGQR